MSPKHIVLCEAEYNKPPPNIATKPIRLLLSTRSLIFTEAHPPASMIVYLIQFFAMSFFRSLNINLIPFFLSTHALDLVKSPEICRLSKSSTPIARYIQYMHVTWFIISIFQQRLTCVRMNKWARTWQKNSANRILLKASFHCSQPIAIFILHNLKATIIPY